MKPLTLLIFTTFIAVASLALKADDSAIRGVGVTSGSDIDLDLAAVFYETINAAVTGTAPVPFITGSTTLAGNVLANVDTVITTSSTMVITGTTLVLTGTTVTPIVSSSNVITSSTSYESIITNNTAINSYPKNLPAGAYQVSVITKSGGETIPIGSFVMPAIITTYTDAPNNKTIVTTQTILQPVPVAPQPDNDFLSGPNALGMTWMSTGIVRFATPDMPALVFKAKKGTAKTSGTQYVPNGEFDTDINPFDIESIVVTNARTGATILTGEFISGPSETTTTNLLSLVLPTDNESLVGGVANLKTSDSHGKKTGSLTFSASGLPSGKPYTVEYDSLTDGGVVSTIVSPNVVSNSRGAVVVNSSTLSRAKSSSGLLVISGSGVDFSNLQSITLSGTNGTPAAWVGF